MAHRKPTDAPRRTSGFTLIELLVVMSIIMILAGVLVGVIGSLRIRSQRDRTRNLIDKVQAALAEYRTEFGRWPEGIPQAVAVIQAADLKAANAAVAGWLYQARRDDYDVTMSTGHIPEIVEDGGVHYLVDPWYEAGTPDHGLDTSGTGYQFLNFARDGFNAPELDIWSNGPDGVSDRDNSDQTRYGDDVVNWGAN